MSYSTCSNDIKTCPDGVCDPLEAMSIYTICPQDCVPKKSISMAHILMKANSNWVRGFGTLRSKNMVCTCMGKSCSCVHKTYAHSIHEEELVTNSSVEPPNYPGK